MRYKITVRYAGQIFEYWCEERANALFLIAAMQRMEGISCELYDCTEHKIVRIK